MASIFNMAMGYESYCFYVHIQLLDEYSLWKISFLFRKNRIQEHLQFCYILYVWGRIFSSFQWGSLNLWHVYNGYFIDMNISGGHEGHATKTCSVLRRKKFSTLFNYRWPNFDLGCKHTVSWGVSYMYMRAEFNTHLQLTTIITSPSNYRHDICFTNWVIYRWQNLASTIFPMPTEKQNYSYNEIWSLKLLTDIGCAFRYRQIWARAPRLALIILLAFPTVRACSVMLTFTKQFFVFFFTASGMKVTLAPIKEKARCYFKLTFDFRLLRS